MKNFIIVLLLVAVLVMGYFLAKKYFPADNTINGSITKLTKPTVINLSNKELSSLNTKILDNNAAEELDVSNNNLTGALPSEIGKLKNLKILKASNNQLTGIPAEIGQLTKLETVDFSHNRIDTMPNEIANLKNSLKTLDLSNNLYNAEYQAKIKTMLPTTNVIF